MYLQGALFVEVRQFVVEPGDAAGCEGLGIGKLFAALLEFLTRFHGHHVPAFGCQPAGIAAGTGADIAGEAGLVGGEFLPGGVHYLGVQGLVPEEEGVGVVLVVVQGAILALGSWRKDSKMA